jgi:hypothetical protein
VVGDLCNFYVIFSFSTALGFAMARDDASIRLGMARSLCGNLSSRSFVFLVLVDPSTKPEMIPLPV